MADVVQEHVDPEDQRCRPTGLAALSIDVEPEVETRGHIDLVGRHQPRTQRVEGLRRLALHPLATVIKLEGTLRHVIGNNEPCDVRPGIGGRVEVAAGGSDDDAELNLVVDLGRAARDVHVVCRTDNGVGSLGKEQRLLRDRHARLRGVVGVVEAGAHEVSWASDGSSQTGFGRQGRQRRDLSRRPATLQIGDATSREERGIQVAGDRRDVVPLAFGTQHSGHLGAGGAHTDELHGRLL